MGFRLAAIVIILFLSPTAFAGFGASDAYCLRFYLDRILGDRSETYIWSPRISKSAQAKGEVARPPLESPEITSRYENKSEVGLSQVAIAPSGEDFKLRFPHDLNDLSQPQTVVKRYLLKAYDPLAKKVTLEREEIRVIQGSPRIIANGLTDQKLSINDIFQQIAPQIRPYGSSPWYVVVDKSSATNLKVFRWHGPGHARTQEFQDFPIKLSDDLYFKDFDQPASTLQTGQIIESKSGLKYEVRSFNEHSQGKLFLRRVDQEVMSWDQFEALAKEPGALRTTPGVQTEARSGISSWLFPSVNRTHVDLVGRKGFKLLGVTSKSLEDFKAIKKDINITQIIQDLRDGNYPEGTLVEAKIGNSVVQGKIEKQRNFLGFYSITNLIREEYGSNNLYKLGQLKILKPGETTPLVIEPEYVRTEAGNSERRYFDVSPVDGIERQYEVQSQNGPVTVYVRYPKSGNSLKNWRMGRIADQLISRLPKAQVDAQGVVLFENGNYYLSDAAGLAHGSEKNDLQDRKISMLGSTLGVFQFQDRVRVFWHETGHSIAQKLWNSNHAPGVEWRRAAALDGKFISGYSMGGHDPSSLVEDFAETVAAYISTNGGKAQPGLRKNFASRFAVLDSIFSEPANRAIAQSIVNDESKKEGLEAVVVIGEGVEGVQITDQAPNQPSQ